MEITSVKNISVGGGRVLLWGRVQPRSVKPAAVAAGGSAPKQPGGEDLRVRTIRVDDDLWAAAKDVAGHQGVSALVRHLLEQHIAEHQPL